MTKLVNQGALVLFSRFVEATAGMVNSIVLARLLGPEGRGKYALVLSITILLSVLGTLGITDGNVYLINRGKYSIHNFISNSICFALGSSVLWVTLFLLFYHLIGYRLIPTLTLNEIALTLSILPFCLLFVYCQNILIGRGAIPMFVWSNIFFATAPLLFLTFFLLDFQLTLREAIYVYMLTYGSSCFFSLWCCIREAGTFRFLPEATLARESLSYGLKSNPGAIFQFARDRLEIIIVAYFMASAAVGYYNIAMGLSDRVKMVPKSFSYILFAEVSKSDKESGYLLASKVVRNSLWFMLPFVGILILFSKYLILVLYGREFLPANVSFSILLGSTLLSAVTFPLGSLFLGQGLPRLYLFAAALSFLTTIGLDICLIPLFGITGAAIANISGLSAMACIYIHAYKKNPTNTLKSLFMIRKDDWQYFVGVLSKTRNRLSLKFAGVKKQIVARIRYEV